MNPSFGLQIIRVRKKSTLHDPGVPQIQSNQAQHCIKAAYPAVKKENIMKWAYCLVNNNINSYSLDKKYFTAENAAAWLACMEKYKPLPYGPRVKSEKKLEICF